MDTLIRRYTGFVRLKSSSYRRRRLGGFDPGGPDRALQGGSGLPLDKETSFRSFAELHHAADHHGDQDGDALQALAAQHLRLVLTDAAGQESDGDCTLGDALPGPGVDEPSIMVISTEELQSLVFCLGTGSRSSSRTRLYLEGSSYEEMAERLSVDTKTIDNALQRVKRKILQHQDSRQVLQ